MRGHLKKSLRGSLWFQSILCRSGLKIELVTVEDEDFFHENFEALSVIELLCCAQGMCMIKSSSWHEAQLIWCS